MSSPRPVPSPTGLVVKNGSKIRSRMSSGTPGRCRRSRRRSGRVLVEPGAHGERARAVHRRDRVVDQVRPHLVQLGGVGRDRRQRPVVVLDHRDARERSCRRASPGCCPGARARRRPGTGRGPSGSTAWPPRPEWRSGWWSPRSRSSAARSRRCSPASAPRRPASPSPTVAATWSSQAASRPACTKTGASSQPSVIPRSSSQSARASSRSDASIGLSDGRLGHQLGGALLQLDQGCEGGPVDPARRRSRPACAASRPPARAARRSPARPRPPGC